MLVIQNIIVGASPFVYTNTSGFLSNISITSGAVSLVEFSRDKAATFLTIGAGTNQAYLLAAGDTIRVTWSVKPTMTLIPMGQVS